MDLTLLLLFYTSGLIAQSYSNAPPPVTEKKPAAIDLKKKPLFCEYKGALSIEDQKIPKLEPECIPTECEVILYADFFVDKESKILTDEDLLKRLTKQKPVILAISRTSGMDDYDEWSTILKPDGNVEEVKVLIEFAKTHPNVIGYLLRNLAPDIFDPKPVNLEVAKNIIPYLKQLKYDKDFIVGVNLLPVRPILKSTCITDFCELNNVVDFYAFKSYYMNYCIPTVSNNADPMKIRPHGRKFLMSMEEATQILKESDCDIEKVFYGIAVDPFDSMGSRTHYCYKDVCTGNIDATTWCIDNTEDFFKKGAYIKNIGASLIVTPITSDDITNACGCGEFIVFRNIIAGYLGKEHIPCPKADVIKPEA